MHLSSPIGIFDSGVGGLTVAAELARLLPDERLLYVADNARAPYGEQSPEAVRAYSREITEALLERGAKMIVIACNTATSVAIDDLRKQHPEVPFVGMEPAVKPAAEQTRNGRVGIMATELTLGSERYHSLLDRFARTAQVFSDPCAGLVPLIEAGDFSTPELDRLLRRILLPMLEADVDTIALGCTHYPLVLKEIRAICGPGINIINPAPAAALQAGRLLERTFGSGATVPLNSSPHRFYATASMLPLAKVLGRLGWRNRILDIWTSK